MFLGLYLKSPSVVNNIQIKTNYFYFLLYSIFTVFYDINTKIFFVVPHTIQV